jgi:hypothetical protein
MRLTKKQREALKQKYDGHCAYCGEILGALWHADHLKPVERQSAYEETSGRLVQTGQLAKPEHDVLENHMPACPTCNMSKGQKPLEVWRDWLTGHIVSLNKYHAVYRMVKRFGLVQETGIPVIFYFEQVRREAIE